MNLTMPKGITLPQQDPLAGLLSSLGSGIQAGSTEALKSILTQRSRASRDNSITNALLMMSGIEPSSNSPTNEPSDVSNYGEISNLSADDLLKLEGIRAQRQSANLAQQKVALQDTKKFREKIREGSENSKRMLKSIKNQKLILEKGLKTGPLTWDALMFRMGMRGAASPQAQAFQANLLDYMEGQREKFGIRLTDADLRLILDKLPDIARTRKGNKLILSLFESQSEYDGLKKEALRNVMKKGVTLDLEDRYDNELERLVKKNPEIENMFENSLNELYKETSGGNIPGIEQERQDTGKERILGKEFTKMPKASEYNGVVIEDENGNKFVSNGVNWRKL